MTYDDAKPSRLKDAMMEDEMMTRTRERAPAWVLEKIREERNAGSTYAEIAAGLIREGISTPQGGTWSASGVHYLLTREKR